MVGNYLKLCKTKRLSDLLLNNDIYDRFVLALLVLRNFQDRQGLRTQNLMLLPYTLPFHCCIHNMFTVQNFWCVINAAGRLGQ
jgi:p-aminobenzoyl-glutamate transporter AbgT